MATVTSGILMLGACAASWAAVQARLEPGTVREGDTLTLIIESDKRHSGNGPDLTALREDFEVLATNTNSETRIINGTVSHLTRWLVQLRPRHTGSIDIAPITLASEQTSALTLNVTEASPEVAKQLSTHVFLEIDTAAAGRSVYVQEQIPYTLRLYYDATVQSGDLDSPNPENAIVEQLGQEKRYATKHDGSEYKVLERRYAIAPQRSGALVIPPVSFRGTVVPSQNRNGPANQADDLMARFLRGTPFGADPFFRGRPGPGMSFGVAPQPVAVSSPQVRLNVQPRPEGAQGNWLPAEQITLHDSWEDDPPRFRVGEPVTRTVTINAKGLAGAQIPQLSLARPDNARLYPDAPENQSKTDGKSVYGTSKQSVTYIPSAQGTLDIAPVELAWWDTRNHAQSRTVLPAREFNVEPGAAQTRSQALPPSPSSATPAVTSAAGPSTAGQSLKSATSIGFLQNHRAWLGGAAGLLAIMILSVLVIRRSRRLESKSAREATAPVLTPRRKPAMRALQRACADNDAGAAQSALLELAQAEWPEEPPRSLGALAARLEAGGEEISALDKSLYGAGGSRWQGDALWRILRRGLQPRRSEIPRTGDGLGALYAQ